MRCDCKTVLMTTLVLVLSGSSWAVPNPEALRENYQSIIERNPFGLKDPPPPVTNAPPVKPVEQQPKTEIFLTGITSIGYPRIPKKAYLMTREQGKQKEPTFYALSEEEGKDGIKVLQIDDRNKKVKVRTQDGELLLTFATHGISPPTNTMPIQPGGRPGQPGAPGVPPALPVASTTGTPNFNQPGNNPGNVAGNEAMLNRYGLGQTSTAAGGAPARQIPSRNVRIGTPGGEVYDGAGAGMDGGANAQPEVVDPALQYIQMKTQEAFHRSRGIPTPPIPPIPQY